VRFACLFPSDKSLGTLEQRSATPMLGLIAPFGEILEGAIFGKGLFFSIK
jgi:hypothetical protein